MHYIIQFLTISFSYEKRKPQTTKKNHLEKCIFTESENYPI